MTPEEQTKKLHAEWLRHPVTQDAMKVLRARQQKYVTDIQNGILHSSNEKLENELRANISCTTTSLIILFDTEQFVKELNKINKE